MRLLWPAPATTTSARCVTRPPPAPGGRPRSGCWGRLPPPRRRRAASRGLPPPRGGGRVPAEAEGPIGRAQPRRADRVGRPQVAHVEGVVGAEDDAVRADRRDEGAQEIR